MKTIIHNLIGFVSNGSDEWCYWLLVTKTLSPRPSVVPGSVPSSGQCVTVCPASAWCQHPACAQCHSVRADQLSSVSVGAIGAGATNSCFQLQSHFALFWLPPIHPRYNLGPAFLPPPTTYLVYLHLNHQYLPRFAFKYTFSQNLARLTEISAKRFWFMDVFPATNPTSILDQT